MNRQTMALLEKLKREGEGKMSNLQIIEQREVLGKDFKIYGDFENPLFLAKDVAEWIENKNPSQMLDTIDDNEKTLYTIYRVDGSTHKSWFLTEHGLYEVLMQSRKPIAKEKDTLYTQCNLERSNQLWQRLKNVVKTHTV